MPLHSDSEEKWGLFLKSIIKDNSNSKITIVATSDQDVTFKADPDIIKYLRNVLVNPETLQSEFVHIQNQNILNFGFVPSTFLQKTAIPAYYNDSPVQLLEKLFRPEYILNADGNGIGLTGNCSLNKFVHNDLTSISTLHLEGTNSVVERDVAKFKMLINSLPSVQTALAILYKEENPINKKSSEPSILSSIFKITINQPPTSADITYNYGLLLQKFQEEENLFSPEKPPVIALLDMDKTEEWTLSKDAIINYLSPICSNVVLPPEIDGQVRPIFFYPKQVSSERHSLHALFDTSRSMSNGFEKFLHHYLIVLKMFIDTIQDWEITIVQFHSEINSKTFNSSHHNFDNIKFHVQTFQSDGTTRLYEALYQSLEQLEKNLRKNLPSTLIVFTDGQDTSDVIDVSALDFDLDSDIGFQLDLNFHLANQILFADGQNRCNSPSMEQVINLAKKVGQNNNFALYSMGLGEDYDQGFFTKLAEDGGFVHVNLNTLDGISQLEQYMKSCANPRKLVQFIVDAVKYIDRFPQDGNPHCSTHTLPKDSPLEICDNN